VRLLAATAIFVLGGTAVLVAGPYGDGDEGLVTVAFIAIPFLTGLAARRISIAWLALLAFVPGVVLVERSTGELTETALYTSLATAILAIAGLLALGAWIGTLLAQRSESRAA
jgi:hypothetical protein